MENLEISVFVGNLHKLYWVNDKDVPEFHSEFSGVATMDPALGHGTFSHILDRKEVLIWSTTLRWKPGVLGGPEGPNGGPGLDLHNATEKESKYEAEHQEVLNNYLFLC